MGSMNSRGAWKLRLPNEGGRLPNRAGQHLGGHLGTVCSSLFAPVQPHSQMAWGADPGQIQGKHSGWRAAWSQTGGEPEAKLVCNRISENLQALRRKLLTQSIQRPCHGLS